MGKIKTSISTRIVESVFGGQNRASSPAVLLSVHMIQKGDIAAGTPKKDTKMLGRKTMNSKHSESLRISLGRKTEKNL